MKIMAVVIIMVLVGTGMLIREFGQYTEDISQRNWQQERRKIWH